MKQILMPVGAMTMLWCVHAENLQPFSENKQILDILTKEKGRDKAIAMTRAADSGDCESIGRLGHYLNRCDSWIAPKHADLSISVLKIAYEKGGQTAFEIACIYDNKKAYADAREWYKVCVQDEYDEAETPNVERINRMKDFIRRCDEALEKGMISSLNTEAAITKEQVDDLKKAASVVKNNTLVFKGLYLGMKKIDAYNLLRFYAGQISNDYVRVEKDGCVHEYALPRNVIDKMFETDGVSGEAFCKSMLSAYPIIEKFDTKSEEIADVKRQKEFIKDAENEALATMNLTTTDDAYAKGRMVGARARRMANQIKKIVPCYYYESPKGFLLEIRPEEPDRFFMLKQISSLKTGNFD